MTAYQIGFQFDYSYLKLPESLYTLQKARPVKHPQSVLVNEDLAKTLGLDAKHLKSPEGVALLSGNVLIQGMSPFAQSYSGHQFGHFTHLGDGRALVLGEHITPSGDRLDIQLKGSGPTPYSRRGDGRASLGPMLREYLISEAMAHLGIPTTRSLAVVATGEKVYRDYPQDGAILTRVASSHIRVGTFQGALSQGSKTLQDLLAYTLKRHYPRCSEADNPAACMLFEFAQRQARLIAAWQSVGFVHGVMNTDNMTLSGETIDYGPCAFMDTYHPDTVFSAIDTSGRYRYQYQPLIGKWNLARFAETLLPLLGPEGERIANESLEYFDKVYEASWQEAMEKKLGLLATSPENRPLIKTLLSCLTRDRLDYHDTFVKLTHGGLAPYPSQAFAQWHEAWEVLRRKQAQPLHLQIEVMQANNPTVIARNHLVEHALSQWTVHDNRQPFMSLLNLLKTPYAYTEHHIASGSPQPHWPKTYTTTCGT